MIVLDSTTDKIQIVNGVTASPELQCFASWRDRTSTTFIAGSSLSTTNGSSAVDAVTGPSDSNTQRIIDYISVYNPGTNSTGNLTIQLNSSATDFILYKANLIGGDTVLYSEGEGFSLISSSGSIRINEVQAVPEIKTGLNCAITSQDYSSPIGAGGRQDSMTDLPLYIPYGNNPVLGIGATGTSVYWSRFYAPYTTSSLNLGAIFTFSLSNVGSFQGLVNQSSVPPIFRFVSNINSPRVVPNDPSSPVGIYSYNYLQSSVFNITAASETVQMLIENWFSPLPAGSPGYATVRFNVAGLNGLIPGQTGFGKANEGSVLYFQKTL